MAIPAYLWLKDDGGADIKGAVEYKIVRAVSRCWDLVMVCIYQQIT